MRSATNQDYRQRLLRVQLHIQEHLDEEITLPELARLAHFSPFHFHRVFRGMTGESVAGYVRRLRIERAAVFLQNTRRPVTRIAFEAGYDSHEAFTRAFRAHFGMAPSAYRLARVAGVEKLGTARLASAKGRRSLRRYIISHSGGKTMKVEIREVPAMRVAFVRHVGPYAQCKGAWDKLCMWAGRKGLVGAGTRMFGVGHDDPDVTPPEKIRYDACVTIDDDVQGEGEINVQSIGGGRYMVATHNGPYEKLSETYAALCGQWAPRSGEELRSAPCLEEYLNDPGSTVPEDLLTDVFVPIE